MFSLFINNLLKAPNTHAVLFSWHTCTGHFILGVPYSIEFTGMSYLTVLRYKNLEVLNISIFSNRNR